MADLRDRGQVMLIAGFVLAASFIALALVLNSVIYTENLATRDTESRGSEATAYRADIVSGGEKMMEYANRNITVGSESYAGIQADFNKSLRSMNKGTARIQAGDGEATNISIESSVEGRRLGQQNATRRDFTAVNGNATWELADGVRGTRAFRINVTDSTLLLDGMLTGDAFTINVTDSSGNEWAANISKDTSGVTNTVLAVNGSGTCEGGLNPTVDLTANTFDGEPCEALEEKPFGEGVSEPYEMWFDEGDKIQGNFSVVVNTTSSTHPNATVDVEYDHDTDTPFEADAIYSTTVHVRHESADIVYATDARLLPGGSDEE